MSRRNFNKRTMERWGGSIAACLVGVACIMAGVYMDQTTKKDNGYVVDLSELDKTEDTKAEEEKQEELAPANIANSDDVVNKAEDVKKKEVAKAAGKEQTSNARISDVPEAAVDDLDALDLKEQPKVEPVQPEEVKQASTSEKPQTLTFGIDSALAWPVGGEIILNYSMDRTVLFPTLNQYKYNPAIYIDAKEGDEVLSCCDGEVTEVASNEEIGSYMTLNLGDGYTLTLGQLSDIRVKQGERVKKGQVLAHVAKTTKYHAVEGDCLYLGLEKDGNCVNPNNFLVSR